MVFSAASPANRMAAAISQRGEPATTTTVSAISNAVAGISVCMPAAIHTKGGKLPSKATHASRSMGFAPKLALADQAEAAVSSSHRAFLGPRASACARTAAMP